MIRNDGGKTVVKMKGSYMFFSFFTFFSIVFGIYAVKCGPYCERDVNNSMDIIERDKEYYDEEMAVELAAAWRTWNWEFQGCPAESVEVIYNYPTNEWIVTFRRDVPRWNRIVVGVRRDNGSMNKY